jgi:NhaP-type Na+/H+ or K+/H+ antiporter
VTAVLTIAVVLIVYSAASGPLGRAGVTSAMAFVVAGLCTGASGLGWLDVPLESAVVERVTELALAFLLFSDSARINVGSLRHSLGWPSRLLLIGLPLTMVAGLGAGLLVFPGMAATSAFLLSTMLCSTDAALGQRVVEDPAVPPRVRQALDVESGLNDGVAVPFFLVALDVSLATLVGGVPSAVISNIASQIGWGVVAGMGAGAVGGAVFRRSMERGWLQAQWGQTFTLAVVLGAYAAAGALGGSGFIAAFVGGMAFGRLSGDFGPRSTDLAEDVGGVLAAVTWMGFGALAISNVLPDITWQVALYALLSLTLVRMLPVAVAMVHTGARRETVAFMGWFGPRGLASIVFGLLALERDVPDSRTLLTTVVVTVGASVFLHGLTAKPFVAGYHRWYAGQARVHPSDAEATPTPLPRRRRLQGPDHAGHAAQPDIPGSPGTSDS